MPLNMSGSILVFRYEIMVQILHEITIFAMILETYKFYELLCSCMRSYEPPTLRAP